MNVNDVELLVQGYSPVTMCLRLSTDLPCQLACQSLQYIWVTELNDARPSSLIWNSEAVKRGFQDFQFPL